MTERPNPDPGAQERMARFHPEVVGDVLKAIDANPVLVVGMGWNPHVKRARKVLTDAAIEHGYVEIGNYSNKWRERLAVKIWSGWPTFPQVYVKGVLIGGADETQAALESGRLTELLGTE